ncbi:hypothetical protein PENTCL1PPCAC_4992, partial [Pristionchus entomophagus]
SLQCEACMFYRAQGKCVMLTPSVNRGTCPVPYACYEKRYSECPEINPPPVDLGYSAGPCSSDGDIIGPPAVAGWQVCGRAPGGPRGIVVDAMLHDGTRLVLENDWSSIILWDPFI